MSKNIRSQNNRVPDPVLPTFLASAAPSSLRTGVLDILGRLEPYRTLDEATLREQQPALLARIVALTSPGLDLFRALRMQALSSTMCSRANVAASLREKWRTDGAALGASAYPPGHVVTVMAWAYWGSIEAWAAARPRRAQQPKNHWQVRKHQLDALHAFAAAHPGQPITHATLSAARLHGLARALSAAELDLLAQELGLGRHLTYRRRGSWTRQEVIDAYAALCRERGVTLSSHALAGIGGKACTFRAQANALFGSFQAFQRAVAACHPDLAPAKCPIAADGTVLDSWSEVVAYNALRLAFPEVGIQVHVLLPGGPGRCSVDFVMHGVHIEVLGTAETEMGAARTARQRKYASQWRQKQPIYQAMGVTPVVIEPADVNDPRRMAARVAEVGRQLAVQPAAMPASTGMVVRAKGEWDFEALCAAAAEVARAVGAFPTYAQLTSAGYAHAPNLLRGRGMRRRVAEAIGVPLRNQKGLWSRDRIVAELAAWVGAHGRIPTGSELKAAGRNALGSAIRRLFRGEQDALRALVGQRCGRTLPCRHMPDGAYADIDRLAALLRPLCDRLGRFPTEAEMRQVGLPVTLYAVVSGRHGVARMAAHMGVAYAGPQRLTLAEALAVFRALPGGQDLLSAAGAPPRLTTTAIRAALGSRGIAMMQKHFGTIDGLRAALAAEDGTTKDD